MAELVFKPRIQVLSEAQLSALHEAVAQILEKTGVRVEQAAAREIFADHGARVEKDVVHIPREMFENALRQAPSKIVLGERRGEPGLVLEKENSFFGATVDDIYYLDPATSLRRPCTMEDCRRVVALFDALPNFSWAMTFGTLSDVPPELADRYSARQALSYSEKPLIFSSNNVRHLEDIVEMARVVVDDPAAFKAAPPVASFVTTISPLVIPEPVAEQMRFCAVNDIPQVIYNGIQAGSTAPMSFGGALAQGSAESLAGLVFIQLVKPGSPVVFGSCATIMDMRSSIFSFGAPEMNLMIAAQCQLAHYYDIPYYGTAGCSDSKLPDAQASAEALFSCFSSALTGANLVHDAGLLEYGAMVSPEHIVLVNEILHMVDQYRRGLDLSPEALALDVLDSVGPGAHFLMHEHTMRNFREVWYSALFDRVGFIKWQENGAKDMAQRVKERTLALMAAPPVGLDEAKEAAIEEMSRHWK